MTLTQDAWGSYDAVPEGTYQYRREALTVKREAAWYLGMVHWSNPGAGTRPTKVGSVFLKPAFEWRE
jgi:hypothetical protein